MTKKSEYIYVRVIDEHHNILLCREERSGRPPVLVKRVQDPARDPGTEERLRRDFAVSSRLAELSVKHILAPSALSERDIGPVIEYPDLPISPLGRLAGGGLATGDYLHLAAGAARALASIHDAGCVHGGLSPRAFLAVEDNAGAGPVVVTGFEYARGAGRDFGPLPEITDFTYAAPEQTGRFNLPVDERSDLYSLGAVLYGLLAGAPPFGVRYNPTLSTATSPACPRHRRRCGRRFLKPCLAS